MCVDLNGNNNGDFVFSHRRSIETTLLHPESLCLRSRWVLMVNFLLMWVFFFIILYFLQAASIAPLNAWWFWLPIKNTHLRSAIHLGSVFLVVEVYRVVLICVCFFLLSSLTLVVVGRAKTASNVTYCIVWSITHLYWNVLCSCCLVDALATSYSVWTSWNAGHVPTNASATRPRSWTESGNPLFCLVDSAIVRGAGCTSNGRKCIKNSCAFLIMTLSKSELQWLREEQCMWVFKSCCDRLIGLPER